MTPQPFRIGAMLLDASAIPRWQLDVLTSLRAAHECDVTVLTCAPSLGVSGVSPSQSRLITRIREWDRLTWGRIARHPDPMRLGSVDASLPDVSRLMLRPAERDGLLHLDALDLARVNDLQLDILLDFSPLPLAPPVPTTAHGVWRLQHGIAATGSAIPPYLLELLGTGNTIEASLRVRTEERLVPRTVARGVWHLYPLSLYVNQVRGFTKAAALIHDTVRHIRARHTGGAVAAPDVMGDMTPDGTVLPDLHRGVDHRRSSTGLALDLVRVLLGRVLRRAVLRMRYEELWLLCIRHRLKLPPWSVEFRGKSLEPPAGHFYADPFLWQWNGATYLFFEDYPFDTRKGVISFVELGADGQPSPASVALECDYHLSYPFMFEHGGSVYMVPETSAVRRIEAFVATDFPRSWSPYRVLLDDVDAVDSILFEYDARFWLVFGRFHPGFGEADELWAYWSESPFGAWTPHLLNPLIRDIHRSRPAGNAFWEGGSLVLPVQDGALRYGHRIRFLRIDRLTPSEWAWSEVGRVDPGSVTGDQATHTYNRTPDFEVVDAQILIRRSQARARIRNLGRA